MLKKIDLSRYDDCSTDYSCILLQLCCNALQLTASMDAYS